MGSGGAEGGVEGEVGYFVFLGEPGLDVTAAFALSPGLGAATGLVAGQPVELGVEAAGREFLGRGDLLAPFPPLSLLGRLGDCLGASLGLGGFGAFGRFAIYCFFLLA